MSADHPEVPVPEEARVEAHRVYYLWWDDDDAAREDERTAEQIRRGYLDDGPLTRALQAAAPFIAAKAVEEKEAELEDERDAREHNQRERHKAEHERDQAVQQEWERLKPVVAAARSWLIREHGDDRPMHPADEAAAHVWDALAALDQEGDGDV